MPNRRTRLFPISAFSFLRRKPARRRIRCFQRTQFRPETLEVRQLLSATPVQPQPLPLEHSDDGFAPIESFPPEERPYVEFVRSLDVSQFRQVRGWQARYLTPGQLQSIPNNRTFRTLPGAVRRNLTTDQLQSLDVRRSGLLGLTRGQIDQLTTEQLHSLRLRDFKRLAPHQIPELTVAQIRRIPSMRWFHRFTLPQREALTTNQVRALDVRKTGLAGLSPDQVAVLTGRQIETLWEKDIAFLNADQLTMLTPQQLEWLDPAWVTDQINGGDQGVPFRLIRPDRPDDSMAVGDMTVGEIRSLTYQDFRTLDAAQATYLEPGQLMTIPTDWWFTRMSSDARAALTPDQIRGLNTQIIGIRRLSDQQVGWLAYWQIRTLSYGDFNRLTPAQVPMLLGRQLSQIPSDWWFGRMTPESRAVLSARQVQSLNVEALGLRRLTASQVESLTAEQIQSVGFREFRYIGPAQIPLLTAAQVGTIESSWWFSRMSEEARAALTAEQVQALDVATTGIGLLTRDQIDALSVDQIQSLGYREFRYLNPEQTPLLTADQIAPIPNSWWFHRISDEARATLTGAQIRALDVAAVGIGGLTDEQIAELSDEQIRQLGYRDFERLSPTQIPVLTPAQVAMIPNEWYFRRIPEASRAAMTGEQVRALNVAELGVGELTAAQVGELSTDQVQSLSWHEIRHLLPSQAPLLGADQVSSINNRWHFERIPDDVRAALTAEQIRELNVAELGLGSLTETQIAELSVEQIQSLTYRSFERLSAEQTPHLTAAQLATIPNEWWFGRWNEPGRAALTESQVQSLLVDRVRLRGLTDDQVAWLTVEQIQSLGYRDFERLGPTQVVHLTAEQVASIRNGWWFTRMSEETRAALTAEQIVHLDVYQTSLKYLTGSQRRALTIEQIQTLKSYDFRYLTAGQVPHLTLDQMGSVRNKWEFLKMSDEARASLNQSQLLALPNVVHAQLNHQPTANFAPDEDHGPMSGMGEHDHGDTLPDHGSDHSTDNGSDGQDHGPHADDPDKRHEHLAVFNLVPHEAATFVSIASGDWSDPGVWEGGVVPGEDAQVLVSADTTVTFDVVQYDAMEWVRVDGTLDWATDIDTQMLVDTVVVDTAGIVQIGSADDPVDHGVAARIVIADDGADIDLARDPNQLSRGLVSHGTTQFYGEEVTPFSSLAVDPRRGDSTLTLDVTPTNWDVGNRLVLTGTSSNHRNTQDEELEIVSIDGNVVTIDADSDEPGIQPLEYNHLTPDGYDLSVYVANVNRNVVIMSENPAITQRRGHVMFMHNQRSQIHNVGFYGLGRTDKRNPANDAIFDDDGQLIEETGLNQRGRYAVHFHRAGTTFEDTPGVVSGSAVVDSPGWGFVNHESYVHFRDNVAFNVVGTGFVTEFGNEIGSFERNLSIRNSGSGDGLEAREDIFDFGHGGHGFWFQGPGVEVIDNISTGARDSAFNFFTSSSEVKFLAENMEDPSLAMGRDEIPVGMVPLRTVRGNTVFGSRSGLETWFHQTNSNAGQSHIDDFTAWNVGRGIFTPYTGRTTIRNATLVGNSDRPRGTAIGRNDVTNQMTYEDMHVAGWDVGISVPVNRTTVIDGGHFEAIRAIDVRRAHDTLRTVDITGDPTFVTLTDSQLRGREQFDIYLNGDISLKNRDLDTYFSPDIVRLGTVRFNNHQVYYHIQAAGFVAFTEDGSPEWIPPELIGKTNTELWQQYGIAPAGVIAPEDAVEVERINGLVGSRSEYQQELDLRSRKYTNELENYELRYRNGGGDLVVDETPVDLREGWNLLTRQVDGVTRTFFVYGDITAPEFTLNADADLRVHPDGLEFGFTVRGKVFDDSVGEMSFRRRFRDLESRPILTEDNGTQFIELNFTIRDLAGNTTDITLRLVLDPTVPLVPGTGQRDLPPRTMPTTLIELLEYYYLTGQSDAEIVI